MLTALLDITIIRLARAVTVTYLVASASHVTRRAPSVTVDKTSLVCDALSECFNFINILLKTLWMYFINKLVFFFSFFFFFLFPVLQAVLSYWSGKIHLF